MGKIHHTGKQDSLGEILLCVCLFPCFMLLGGIRGKETRQWTAGTVGTDGGVSGVWANGYWKCKVASWSVIMLACDFDDWDCGSSLVTKTLQIPHWRYVTAQLLPLSHPPPSLCSFEKQRFPLSSHYLQQPAKFRTWWDSIRCFGLCNKLSFRCSYFLMGESLQR